MRSQRSAIYLSAAYVIVATTHAQTCVTADRYINQMPLYGQHNAAFPKNGANYCAPAVTAMMIRSQLDKPGVTARAGSWTYNNFSAVYTTQVLAEASAMHIDARSGTAWYNVYLGFQNPLQDVRNSNGTASVYEQDAHYPTQRTLRGYKAKLKEGYAVGLLIDYVREKRIYDGFPSCHLDHYEYHKHGGHYVAVRGFDGSKLFINNPLAPSRDKREFGVIPHTKNGVPVRVYLENNQLVPDTMNVNYLGPVKTYALPTTCSTNDANCKCDIALGISKAPVYAATPMDALYLAH